MKYLVFILVLALAACTPAMDAETQEMNPSSDTPTETNPDLDANGVEVHGEDPTNDDFSALPQGEYAVSAERVQYFDAVEGVLVEPEGLANAPGVILIHEWWGLNENMEETARRVASHGYRVLAVDIYEGQVAATPDEARELRVAVQEERAMTNLAAANKFLRERGSMKTASWGYCFGGEQSATFSLEGETDATVVYYGNLAKPLANPDAITSPMLLIFGSEDTSTTLASAQELQTTLQGLDKSVELHGYEGRGHAFANPSNAGHDKTDTRDAWDKTLAFLAKNLN